jgi:hypothetical protein
MKLLSVLGFLSFVLTIAALWLMGMPSRWCFITFIISILAQAYIFWKTEQWWLLSQMAVLMTFNIVNYFRWLSGGIG